MYFDFQKIGFHRKNRQNFQPSFILQVDAEKSVSSFFFIFNQKIKFRFLEKGGSVCVGKCVCLWCA